jgi:phosphopentomutase
VTEAKVPRVLILVCDSFGVGDAPDVDAYDDAGSDTLGNTAAAVGGLDAPNLGALGLGMLTRIEGVEPRAEPGTAHGRLTERSAGKDTTTGHCEMAGIVLQRPFPLYPDGFPPTILGPFEARVGRRALGNVPASGTEIIAELGPEHLSTGAPIVYTSGDSVFQIASHRRGSAGAAVVVRSHARPRGRARRGRDRAPVHRRAWRVHAAPGGATTRAASRAHPADRKVEHRGRPRHGKIQDIFARQGLTEGVYSDSNDHGIELTIEHLGRPGPALVFTNLVDFDSKYGHRNDPEGYARAIERLDGRLPELIGALDGGVLLLTGDHGCDPTTPSTDHSRERTPLLAAGLPGGPYDVGARDSFADLGATVAGLLGVPWDLEGTSFAAEIGL